MNIDEKHALEDYIEFNLHVMVRGIEQHIDPSFKEALWDSCDNMMDDLRATFTTQVDIDDADSYELWRSLDK
jgi:hypothetical protein